VGWDESLVLTPAASGHVVPAPDVDNEECGEVGEMVISRGNRTGEKLTSGTLLTLNPKLPDWLNPELRGGKTATNCLKYGTIEKQDTGQNILLSSGKSSKLNSAGRKSLKIDEMLYQLG
jgi:hypothetical protein